MPDGPRPWAGARIAVAGRVFPHTLKALTALGVEPVAVADGDPVEPGWDALLLYRHARKFHRYERMLGGLTRRPPVGLWQHEPLPPIEMAADWERRALAVAARTRSVRWAQPALRLLNRPFYQSAARKGFGPYSGDRATLHGSRMVRPVMEALHVVRRGVAEGWLDHVFVTTEEKRRSLADRGIASSFVPVGIHAGDGEERGLQRDLDIVYIGQAFPGSARRMKIERLKTAFAQRGIRFVPVRRDLYGEARTTMLNRSKIMLHLHNYAWDTPWMRWNLAAANGAMMLSEPLSVPEPFVPGRHYVEAEIDDMPKRVAELLQAPGRIEKIAAAASGHIRQHMTMESSLRRILDTLLSRS